MANYIVQADIEDLFGEFNIAVWSNLDNASETADVDRINRAIAYSEQRINDTMDPAGYVVPLVGNSTTALDTIKNIAATFAGWWLYSSRGIRDEDEVNRLVFLEEKSEKELQQYISGQRRLNAKMKNSTPGAPSVIF